MFVHALRSSKRLLLLLLRMSSFFFTCMRLMCIGRNKPFENLLMLFVFHSDSSDPSQNFFIIIDWIFSFIFTIEILLTVGCLVCTQSDDQF